MEFPRVAKAHIESEFDILNLDENEIDINKIQQAIAMARRLIQSWGRNGEEHNMLNSFENLLLNNPSSENKKKAVRYLKSLFSDKQDYN